MVLVLRTRRNGNGAEATVRIENDTPVDDGLPRITRVDHVLGCGMVVGFVMFAGGLIALAFWS